MFQVVIYLFVGRIFHLVPMLTLPNPLIQQFYAHRALVSFLTRKTYNLWSPFLFRKLANRLFFHLSGNLKPLGLLRWRCPVIRCILSSCFTLLTGLRFSSLLNVEGWTSVSWVIFLPYSCSMKCLNLIHLYQTELSVIFVHSNIKVVLLGQKAKKRLQAFFAYCFKNYTYHLNSAILIIFQKILYRTKKGSLITLILFQAF